jgi:hypothetical protein
MKHTQKTPPRGFPAGWRLMLDRRSIGLMKFFVRWIDRVSFAFFRLITLLFKTFILPFDTDMVILQLNASLTRELT